MDINYLFWGSAMIVFGIINVIIQIKKLLKDDQDKLGFEMNILISSIMFVVIGVIVIVKNSA